MADRDARGPNPEFWQAWMRGEPMETIRDQFGMTFREVVAELRLWGYPTGHQETGDAE
jgi:hypothetical protein